MRMILIVDDEKLIRWSLSEFFREVGFEVIEAATGAEALEQLTRQRVSVALVDYYLPDGNGVKVLKAIKKLGPDCLVIIMTVSPSREAEAEALEHGAHMYVEKPVNLTELVPVITKALSDQLA